MFINFLNIIPTEICPYACASKQLQLGEKKKHPYDPDIAVVESSRRWDYQKLFLCMFVHPTKQKFWIDTAYH